MSSGVEVGGYGYDAYGNLNANISEHSDVAQANPFRYRGYYQDDETGYYYLKSRYYDARMLSFISADDPAMAMLGAGAIGGTNLYAYCNFDPINYTDSTGHAPDWKRIGGWFAVAGVAIVGGVLIYGGVRSGGGLSRNVLLGAGIGAYGGMIGSIALQGGFKDSDPWKVFRAGLIGGGIGAFSGAFSYMASKAGRCLGGYLGQQISRSAWLQAGRFVNIYTMMKAAGTIGSIAGGIAGSMLGDYMANTMIGNNQDANTIVRNGIVGEIPTWLLDIFRWMY